MKKQILYVQTVLLIVLSSLTSCTYSQSFATVRGHGTPVEKNYKVSDFKGIDVSGGFDVILKQDDSESVMLSAQENLFDYITVKVENGTLKIYTRNNIMTTQPMKANISYKNIKDLSVSGGGDVISKNSINADELSINLSGGGDFSSAVNSNKLDCKISGGGDAKIEGDVKDYHVEISGGGDLDSKVNAGIISCKVTGGGDLSLVSEEKSSEAVLDINGGGDFGARINTDILKCFVSGGGDATLAGQADGFEINLNGGGDVNATDLKKKTTTFRVGGGSDIYVNASQEINGTISGGGDVYYSGNPDNVNVDAKGGSKIHKR
jgi:hypothetical protein